MGSKKIHSKRFDIRVVDLVSVILQIRRVETDTLYLNEVRSIVVKPIEDELLREELR